MPAEWREVRLGDLVQRGALAICDGYRVRNDELGPEGIPFVRGGDIGDGWINTAVADHIKPEFAHRVTGKLSRPGDAAFITKGTVGRAGRLRVGQPEVVFAPQVAYWRVLDSAVLDPTFLFFFMRSHAFRAALDSVKTHGAMVADYVSISQQHDFRFLLPDIDTQRAIARLLGALDDKIDLNRRISETLEATAGAIFRSWFVDFEPVRANAENRSESKADCASKLFPVSFEASDLGIIPSGWRVSQVDGLINATKGTSYSSDDLQESDTALVTLKSFTRGGGYRHNGLKAFVGRYKPQQVVRPGEMILACTDVTQAADVIGRPALVRSTSRYRTLVASLDTMILRPAKQEHIPFFYFLFRSEAFTAHAYAHTTGTTVLHLARTAVPSFTFPLPPESLIQGFGKIAAPCLQRVECSDLQNETIATVRDTLLPKLISGELRVPEVEKSVESMA